MRRALARFVGLTALLYGVELLERVAYRAGALDLSRALAAEEIRKQEAADLEAVALAVVMAAHKQYADEDSSGGVS